MQQSVPADPAVMSLRYSALTDAGHVRPNNEDAYLAAPTVIAVADGVGGEAAGEVASELAVTALVPLDAAAPGDALAALRGAVDAANTSIRVAVEADSALTGMGTTLTALLLSGKSLVLAHAGDSRAYLLHDGEVSQLTRDDTYVQWLVDEGCISSEEAGTHPHRSVVTRVLRGAPVDATYDVRDAVLGDRYLLCSDGLPAAVTDDEVAAALRDHPDVDACAERLVELALAGGAPDNVTVVVADVVAGPPADGAELFVGR
jgi:protein phosphatase